MKRLSLLFLIINALAWGALRAQSLPQELTEIVIGEGTETTCEIPFNSCTSGLAYTESIYPAEAIGGPCMVYSISFDVAELASFWNGSWLQQASLYYFSISIFLGTTSQSNHSSLDNWIAPEQLSIAYQRNLNIDYDELFTETGWTTFDLDVPFHYEGGNLVIGISINSYLYWDSFDNYIPLKINGTIANGASLSITGISNIPEAGTEGTLYDIRPNIRLGVIEGPSLVAIPEFIEMGPRPSGCWMAPANALLYNEGISSTITSITRDNDFFICEGLETPYAFSGLDTIPIFINTGTGIGAQTGTLTLQYGNGMSAAIGLNATAYAPITPDVWEMPRIITEFPFSETITGDVEIYDNYNLPGNGEDGKDIVWKMTFDYDVYVSIMVEGNNPKMAVYEDGFQGEEGPSIGNVFKKGDDNGILSTGLFQGTYYVVASSTSETFTVSATQEDILLPVSASSPTPVNHFNCYDGNATSIGWKLGEFSHEYQLLFGETNPPTEVLVDWTYDLAESCNVLTEDSKTYYWRVNERNSSGSTEGSVWTFTTFKDITPSANNIIYVTSTGAGVKDGSSWDNAASNLQAAIDAAAAVQENRPDIWVAKGTYLANGAFEEVDGHACVFHSYNDVKLYGSLNGDEAADFDMSLRDFDNNATILDAESVCYVVGSQGATWDGFVIQHGGEGGMLINPTDYAVNTIRNCKVLYSLGNGIYDVIGDLKLYDSQVSYHSDNGIFMYYNQWNNLVEGCVISYNTNNGIHGCGNVVNSYITNNGNGVIINSGDGVIKGCVCANNNGNGANFTTIINSIIVNNGIGVGRIYSGGSELNIKNCVIWGNDVQFPDKDDPYYWFPYVSVTIKNNAIQDGVGEKSGLYPNIILAGPGELNGIQPGFVNPSEGIGAAYFGGDWSLLPNSPCINMGASSGDLDIEYDIAGNPRIQQGRIDIGAFESPYEKPNIQYAIRPDNHNIIYVKENGTGDGSSWDNASGDLYQAMETAVLYEPAATLWVAEGNYPTADYSFLVKQDLKMYGSFEGNEPADYDLSQRDFTAHPSVLDGREAMRILHQSDTLSTTNAALIDGFTLRNGLADIGAGAYLLKNTTLSHCTVENNTTNGGEGKGGGIYADGAILHDSFVRNNTANQGGGIYAINSTLCQTLISNNEAETGGGIYAQNTEVLQSNILKNQGDGLCVFADGYNDFVHLNNTVLWGNEGKNVQYMSNIAQANTIINHCAIEGLQNADNDNVPLSADNEGASGPWFVAPVAETGVTEEIGDWQLQEASVCIDGGSNNYGAVNYDLNGSSRIQNGRIDIGVYESPYEAQCVNIDIREVSIREGETYAFYGSVLSEPGIYEHRWTEGGCDSLVMLHLHVADIVFVSENGAGLKDGSSWDNALDGNTVQSDGYTKLAYCLAEATPYTEFWLTDGNYLPCGDQDNLKSFTLNEGVRIYGGFSGIENTIDERDFENSPTIFTGELQSDDNSNNNTECLFVTATPSENWIVPAIIDGVTLTQGYASAHQGAALRICENTSVNIQQCQVIENYEGAVCNWGKLEVRDSNLSENIEENQADMYDFVGPDHLTSYYYSAGAISNRENAVTMLTNCVINSNYSIHNGALFNAGEMKIEDTEFDNNTADRYAVILSPGKIKIINAVFNNNRAENRIGVMYVWDSLYMDNCIISNNHSNYYAATHFPNSKSYPGQRTSGIQSLGYSIVSSCSFINNNANTCPGGALSIMGQAEIKDCVFSGNKGVSPWLDPNDPQSGLVIVYVSKDTDGAALYVNGSANVTNCVFNNNHGYKGNTIGVDGTLNMEDCKITEGHSTIMSNGAIKVIQGGLLCIKNSLIANNASPAIQQEEGANTFIEASTIVNSGTEVFVFQTEWNNNNPSWVNINNSILSGYQNLTRIDSLGYGDEGTFGVEGTITVANSLLHSGFESVSLQNLHDEGGNLYDVDPMFVNPTTVLGIDENLSAIDADWRLQAGSPCINAGDATLIDLDSLSLDLGGEMRVKNCEIDMGAYEYGDMVWDTIADMTCEGEPYADNGFDLPAMDPGDYVFQRTGDCEDNTLHTLLLHVNPKTYHSISQVVTEPYELNGITYSESGTYVQTLPNQYGCDSIITLHLVVTPIYVQTTELFQGWTWWAPTVETNVADIEAALGDNLESIQSQSGSANGNTILGQMYRIKTTTDCTLTLSGIRTTNAVTITLLPGYNWFGYTGTQPLAIENLNITPAEGDKVISQDGGFAIFNGDEWEGTLQTLVPGHGYVYVSNSATSKTLVIGQ